MRSTRRLAAIGLLMGVLLGLLGPTPYAHAEPTDTEKVQAATAVAQEKCSAISPIPAIGDKLTKLCTDALVMVLTDPTKSVANLACTAELATLGLSGVPGVQQKCVELVQPLVAAAGVAMAAKLEQLADVVECVESTVQGDVFACQTKLVQHWIGKGVQLVWGGLSGVILAPTRAVNIIDLRANPDAVPEAASFRSLYSDIGWLAGSLVGVFVMLSLIQALLRRSGQIIKESIAGVAAWGVFWIAGMAIAVLILQATDGMALFLGGEGGSKMQLSGIEKWLAAITKATGAMTLTSGVDLGSIVGVILTLVILIAVLMIFVMLALREVSVVLIAVMLPVLLGMQAGPGAMRRALPNTAKAFVTIAVSKPLVVVGLRLGAGFLSVPADGKLSLWGMLLGAVVLGISAFSPGVLYKLFGVVETAASGRSGGGAHAIDSAGRSAVDTADSARSVFSANAPTTPIAAKSATAGATGASSAGAGVSAGAGASAAAGPLGLVIGAGMMAASTAVSAGGAIASQVGTGGGALGDAEAMHPGQFPRSYGGGLPPRAAADLAPVAPYEPSPNPPTPPQPPVPAPKP